MAWAQFSLEMPPGPLSTVHLCPETGGHMTSGHPWDCLQVRIKLNVANEDLSTIIILGMLDPPAEKLGS